jgi:hypothetical protein
MLIPSLPDVAGVKEGNGYGPAQEVSVTYEQFTMSVKMSVLSDASQECY